MSLKSKVKHLKWKKYFLRIMKKRLIIMAKFAVAWSILSLNIRFITNWKETNELN